MSDEWTVTLRVPADADLEAAGETVSLRVREDETILRGARDAGVWLPADCQQGWCIGCAARLVEGELDNTNAKRYYEEDRKAGYVLPCVAEPRSDVELEMCQYDEMLHHRAENDRPPGRSKLP